MAFVLLAVLVIAGGFTAILVTAVSAEGVAREAHAASDRQVEEIATGHGLLHALAAGEVIVGVNAETSALFYKLGDQPHVWIPLSSVASVGLTPIYERWSETAATTTTSRGSQLIGAGVGMAVAGPFGALIGGTTGTLHTSSTTHDGAALRSLELVMRVRDAHRPRLVLSISQKLPSGTSVPLVLEARSKDLAAFIATAIEDGRSTGPAVEQARDVVPPPAIAWPSAPKPKHQSRGWWQRTFGA